MRIDQAVLPARPGRAEMARFLSYFFFAGGTLAAIALIFFPLPGGIDLAGTWATIGAAFVAGVVLRVMAGRLPETAIGVGLAFGTLAITCGVYFAAGIAPETFYVWAALYAGYFFGARHAALHVVLVAVAYAVVLIPLHSPRAYAAHWLIVVGTAAVAALLISVLTRRLHRTADEAARRAEELRDAEERFRRAFDDAAIGMALVSLDGRWLRVNRALARLTGYSEEYLTGLRFRDITHRDDHQADREALHQLVSGQRTAFQTEKRYIHADGHPVWVLLNVSMVRDGDGHPLHLISQIQDITERKGAEAELAHQAVHDPLTGLPNRLLFLDRLQMALSRLERERGSVAVLFLDLDRFKVVNDSLGHNAGDQVIVEAATRLSGVLRPSDTLSRFGGDEFTILCESLIESEAAGVAERIAEALTGSFEVNGQEVFLSASIGIAVAGDHAARPDALLRDADAAMYQAKERGKSRYALFEGGMRLRATERLSIEGELRRAVERDELIVHYQPEVRLETGAIVGVEALVRWEHPQRGRVFPNDFIRVAEESGLIVPIGEWVLAEACRQSRLWAREHAELQVAVNISPRQLADRHLCDAVGRALEENGIAPETLCLEITESALMDDAEAGLSALRRLKEMGVQLAIDDFGVGFSSLSQIRRLPPVDILKIDRSFISGLGREREDSAIVAAVIGMAHSLGLTAVGEGVETAEQAEELIRLGCDLGQGYYFSRPQPADALPRLLTRASLGELLA